MSSEKSGKDCINGEVAKSILVVKSLPRRAANLGRIFKQLDKKLLKNKSKHSREQTLPHIFGLFSTRTKLDGFANYFFDFAEN